MQEGLNLSPTNLKDNNQTIIKTDTNSKNGQDKCPKCGSTDISVNTQKGKLRCNFCRFEFEPQHLEGMVTNIQQLQGEVLGSGAQDIQANVEDILTFKCSSCGAEVVIDTSSASQARCHWCRNTLSVNQQIPNGSIPDVVLPFNINKDTAKLEIEKFVGKRKFFAHPKFKKEFTTNNIMGVYFPYMLVDVNAHATLKGKGEQQTGSYYSGTGENRRIYYNADLYHVEREFDIAITGLSVESSSDRLNTHASDKTNNVINAIMPFDIENCVKYNANYLKGYTSEKRDTNISELKEIVETQAKDVAKFSVNDTLKAYNRGVAWSSQQLEMKGEQWKAAYLPVWLYSYQQVNGDKKILHYVAVNARTKETMGSVPLHMPKLFGISILIEILGIFLMSLFDSDYNWLFLLTGFLFYFYIYRKYRNTNARHTYETETKNTVSNIRKVDQFIQSETGLSTTQIDGANNYTVNDQNISDKILDNLTGQDLMNTTIDVVTRNGTLNGFLRNQMKNNRRR